MDRIDGANTVNIGSGRRGFRQQNREMGIAGTELTSAWFNAIQEELLAVIEGAGLVADDESWTQLRQAIQQMITAALPEPDMSPYLQKAGGTMLGDLNLAHDPTADAEAANKHYVDLVGTNVLAAVAASLAAYLLKTGGTMTGFLTLHANPANPLHAVPKQYLDASLAGLPRIVKPAVASNAATVVTMSAGMVAGRLMYNIGGAKQASGSSSIYHEISVDGGASWLTIDDHYNQILVDITVGAFVYGKHGNNSNGNWNRVGPGSPDWDTSGLTTGGDIRVRLRSPTASFVVYDHFSGLAYS